MDKIKQNIDLQEAIQRYNIEKSVVGTLAYNIDQNLQKGMSVDEAIEDVLQKSKSMPIGTITNGYKKIAEGKWRKVSEHGMTREEHEKRSLDMKKYAKEALTGSDKVVKYESHKMHEGIASKLDPKDYSDEEVTGEGEKDESDFKIINDASSVSALMTPIWGNKSKGFLYFTDGLRVDIPTINERLNKSGDRKLVSLLDVTGTNGENQQDPHTFKNDKIANSFSVRVNKKGRFELLQHKID